MKQTDINEKWGKRSKIRVEQFNTSFSVTDQTNRLKVKKNIDMNTINHAALPFIEYCQIIYMIFKYK